MEYATVKKSKFLTIYLFIVILNSAPKVKRTIVNRSSCVLGGRVRAYLPQHWCEPLRAVHRPEREPDLGQLQPASLQGPPGRHGAH